MSAQAFHNGFENLYHRTYEPWTGTTTSGNPTSQNSRIVHARAQRAGYSKNPIIDLNGFKYRKDSDYVRIVHNYENYPGAITGSGKSSRIGFFSDTVSESGYLFTYPFTFGGHDGDLLSEKNQSITECLLKLKEDKVQLGQFLAEAKQSVNMLADSASKLFRLLLLIKRREWPKRPKGQQVFGVNAANLYLQWKYGWLPLCSDLKRLFDDAQSDTKSRPMVLKATRNIKSNWTSSSDVDYWDGRNQTVKATNTCQIMANVKPSFLANANAYGLINPLSLGWELIPFSFVVDWAMPIGNFLEALSAPVGLDFLTGFTGQRLEGTIEANRKLTSGWKGTPQSVSVDAFVYRRTRLTNFPFPQLYVKSPFSTGNVLSALALLRQLR